MGVFNIISHLELSFCGTIGSLSVWLMDIIPFSLMINSLCPTRCTPIHYSRFGFSGTCSDNYGSISSTVFNLSIKIMTQTPMTQFKKNIITAAAALTHRINILGKRLNCLIQSKRSLIYSIRMLHRAQKHELKIKQWKEIKITIEETPILFVNSLNKS